MKHVIILIGVFVSILACSCSGGGPVSPGTDIDQAVRVEKSADNTGHRMLWGLWEIHGDMRTGEMGIVPVRSGEAHLNALAFLEPPAGTRLKINWPIEINGDVLDVDISLTHPFPAQTQFTGFDVKGIVITQGDSELFCGPLPLMADEDWTRMLNPDGYTLWWSPFHFPSNPDCPNQGYIDGLWGAPDSLADYDTTINGYKYFCDDLGPDDDLSGIEPANRGMFSTGKTNTRHYTIKVVGDTFEFNYAVDACWAWPVNIPPFEIPGDFPVHANQPEAYRIEIEEVKNTLYYDGYFGGGDLFLDITVYTWRDPSTTLNVYIESPLVFHEVFSSEPVETGDGWARYRLEATSCSCRETGEIFVLVGVQTGLVKILTGADSVALKLEAFVSTYFPYSTEVGAIPPSDGPPGFPRGFHPGEFQTIPEPPGYVDIQHSRGQLPAVKDNHIAYGISVKPLSPAKGHTGILESLNGGETFEIVVMDAQSNPIYVDLFVTYRTLEILIDSDDGVHLLGRDKTPYLDKPPLSYAYKPNGGEPQEVLYPLGETKPFSTPYIAAPLMDGEGMLHLIYSAKGPETDPDPPRLYEITSANYVEFSEPVECMEFPESYYDDEDHFPYTVFAMSDDGELYVAFPAEGISGYSDVFFSHGYPGSMSAPVRIDEDLPEAHEQKLLYCQLIGKDYYVSWYNTDPLGWEWDYPRSQVCRIPDGGNPENPVDIVIPGSSYSYMCKNSFSQVAFSTFISSRGGNSIQDNTKRLLHHKISNYIEPVSLKGNFVIPSNATEVIAISNSGIIAVGINNDLGYYTQYSYSEFDFY